MKDIKQQQDDNKKLLNNNDDSSNGNNFLRKFLAFELLDRYLQVFITNNNNLNYLNLIYQKYSDHEHFVK